MAMACLLLRHFPRFSHWHCSLPLSLTSNLKIDLNSSHHSNLSRRNRENCTLSKHCNSTKLESLNALPSSISDHVDGENGAADDSYVLEFNRVNCLVRVLHESARSFSLAVESLQLPGNGLELAMAWKGKDVHEWHRHIAYQVAVYGLLRTAIEVEILLSQERHNNPSPVKDILTPKTSLVGDYIEGQLNARHPELVEWFRVVELPRVTGFFIPLLKKWSMEYAGSGVAGIIVAISCCVAIKKLGSRRTSWGMFILSIDDVLIELLNLSYTLVSVDKLHNLSTLAGFEHYFLSHFGTKIIPCDLSEELEFWIGLAQKKLSLAFQKETLPSCPQEIDKKVQADSLATLGLFAYLGRKTRIFLSSVGIDDLDEHVKDLLGYLECGILFIYPQFSCIPIYQCFVEVVTDEIGWLEFYGELDMISYQEKRKTKHHTIQAEKEIFLSTVFTVCYDVFSGFAHFSRSTQQCLDSDLLKFLLQSQSVLSICLEDYWAAYDRSSDLLRIAEISAFEHTVSTGAKGTTLFPSLIDSQVMASDMMTQEYQNDKPIRGRKVKEVCKSASQDTTTFSVERCMPVSNSIHGNLIKKYSMKLISKSFDLLMGTQLFFVDFVVSVEILLKHLRGESITVRESKKLKKTFRDIITLLPMTILMLLPVSVVGHAAILAAIKKYAPFLIPSPYSSERLEILKQLKRARKMDIKSWSYLEEPLPRRI